MMEDEAKIKKSKIANYITTCIDLKQPFWLLLLVSWAFNKTSSIFVYAQIRIN